MFFRTWLVFFSMSVAVCFCGYVCEVFNLVCNGFIDVSRVSGGMQAKMF